MKKIKVFLLGLVLALSLTGCEKEEQVEQTQYTEISNIENVSFEIPSYLLENAQNYNEFIKNKVTVTNDFQYGTVERTTLHQYLLTDYENFYLYCTDAYPFTTNLIYMNDVGTMKKELEATYQDLSLSNFQYSHEDNVVEIMAEIEFTPVFEDATNIRKIEKASGTIILYGVDEKQYLFVYVDNNQVVNRDEYIHLLDSFQYKGNESSIYANEGRTVKEYSGDNCGIQICYNKMAIEEEEQIIIPACNQAKITTTVFNTDTDHELTAEELLAQATQEEVKSRTILWKDVEVSNDGIMTWQGRTFSVVDVNNQAYNECIYVTSMGKTMITISATYTAQENILLNDDVNNCVKDLVRQSVLLRYVDIQGQVVECTEAPTTEATTEATTEKATEVATEVTTEATTQEQTTQATTEATTEATTQATTQATTEATTQATTQAPKPATTQANKKKQQSTTEKKTNNKNNKNDDLDVEW